MKPTKAQLEVINFIKDQVNFWEGTNDLSSPTHLCDIDECLNALEDTIDLPEHRKDRLRDLMQYLYYFIKNTD